MTPAIRAVRAAGIAFEALEYAHDPTAESYGLEAAAALGVAPSVVFKTLIAETDGKSLAVALVPVHCTLDLKAFAAALDAKRASMAAVDAAERATGYVAGGISPLGQRKRLPTVVDASVATLDRVYVSGGRRGLELVMTGRDLIRMCEAIIAPIARCDG